MLLQSIALSLWPFLLLALAAVLVPSVRYVRAGGIAAVVLLAVLATPLVSNFLLSRLELWAPISPSKLSQSQAQAIVVLSADQQQRPEFGGLGPGPLSLERLRYGAFLAKRTDLPVLISGGIPSTEGVTLADTLASAFEESFGVRARWLERRSLNTIGNADETAKILKTAGVTRVLLVTHSWHMRRARLAFERAGLHVTPAPTAATGDPLSNLHSLGDWIGALTPQARNLQTSYYFVHEMVGWLMLSMTPPSERRVAGQAGHRVSALKTTPPG